MNNKKEAKYKIDPVVIKNYVNAINSIAGPMNQIMSKVKEISGLFEQTINSTNKEEKINQDFKSINLFYESIDGMSEEIKKLLSTYPKEQAKIFTDLIKQIMEINNGIISSRIIEPLNISRQYLSNLENEGKIERIARGIYISSDVFMDEFYSFQLKYKKTIFSHMNALYFYGITEEVPYNFTVTVPQSYHTDVVNEKCNVFYVADDIFEIGLCEAETPNGNKVRAYDLERSICDIIRSKNRMDMEQVKKTVKQYMKLKDKDLCKLSEYAEKMGIKKQVIETVGMYDE